MITKFIGTYNSPNSCYNNDLHNHMKWAAIIVLSLTILMRYIIKLCKWVAQINQNELWKIKQNKL